MNISDYKYYYAIYIDDDEQPPVFIKVTTSKDNMSSFLNSQFNIENDLWINNIYYLKDNVIKDGILENTILKTLYLYINKFDTNIVYSSPIKPRIVILGNNDGDLIDIMSQICSYK